MTTTSDDTRTSRTTPLSPETADLLAALARVQQVSPAELPGPQALADTAALLQAAETLSILLLTRLGDVQTRALHQLDGARSTTAWLRTQQAGGDDKQLPLARKLTDLPLLREALDRGRLPIRTASKLADALTVWKRHVDRPDDTIDGQPGEQTIRAVVIDGVHDALCEAHGGLPDDDPRVHAWAAALTDIADRRSSQLLRLEAALILLARNLTRRQLPSALDRLADALLPNRLEQRADDAERDRGLTLTPNPNGVGGHVCGDLTPECYELLATVLNAEMTVDPDNPQDTADYTALRASGWQPGDPMPDHPHDTPGPADAGSGTGTGAEEVGGGAFAADGPRRTPRSLAKRRHDALRNGLARLLDNGLLGTRDKAAPHIGVIVPAAQLDRQPGALPAVGGATGQSLPRSLVLSLGCSAYLTRYVLGLGRRVIETSHTERTLKPHERRAKHLETGGTCQGAGCIHGPTSGRPLIPHHVDAYSRCGSTSYADTVLLCGIEHHDIHTGKKTIQLKDGRWLNENGWTDGPA